MHVILLLLLLFATPIAAAEITRESVLQQMNAYRAERGFPALQIDSRLEAAAESRMREMEESGYWAHQSPDGASPFRWLDVHGYKHRYAGENLASGFETAELLVASWMESRGHRQAILSPLYQDCGIAIIDGSTTKRATGKSVVVLFGRAADSEPAETASNGR